MGQTAFLRIDSSCKELLSTDGCGLKFVGVTTEAQTMLFYKRLYFACASRWFTCGVNLNIYHECVNRIKMNLFSEVCDMLYCTFKAIIIF